MPTNGNDAPMTQLDVRLDVEILGLPSDDPKHQGQVASLVHDLAASLPTEQRGTHVPGSKGLTSDLVIRLLTPQNVGLLIAVLSQWCARDRDRSVRVRWNSFADGDKSLEVDGKTVSDETLRQVAAEALKRDLPDE
jgi:hypothetical protein